jgi:peptidoglycan/xylan/chitin deacetylase (PgdA/CDA1 family)
MAEGAAVFSLLRIVTCLWKTLKDWDKAPGRVAKKMMTAAQINEACQNETFELGAHTISHPVLSSLNKLEQRGEIEGSKNELEDIAGRRITAFSYPHGGHADYDDETVALVKAAGFECACSNFEGCATSKTDWFQLPRVYVHDCGGELFLKQIWRIVG